MLLRDAADEIDRGLNGHFEQLDGAGIVRGQEVPSFLRITVK
jgi:hypothetical protein